MYVCIYIYMYTLAYVHDKHVPIYPYLYFVGFGYRVSGSDSKGGGLSECYAFGPRPWPSSTLEDLGFRGLGVWGFRV